VDAVNAAASRHVASKSDLLAAPMEAAMTEAKHGNETAMPEPERDDIALPTGSGLHPRVYTIVIGLAAWFALAVWIFAGKGITDYLLFIVSAFISISVALTLILASVASTEKTPSGEPPARESKPQSFHDWATGSFGTWSGRVTGKQAMVQVLLPFVAAALGMTILGIVLHLTAGASA
jgi:hypothetical protein